ncbi:MAG: flagellar type III secretion system pore protein FliP, partial [Planctomycetota bacterium JB042]
FGLPGRRRRGRDEHEQAEPSVVHDVVDPANGLVAPPAAPATVPRDGDDPARTAGSLDDTVREFAAPIRVMLLLSTLVFLPALLLTLTCYTRIIIVLSFVRRAIGAQELPPNPILVGLALFLTSAVMSPTFGKVHDEAIEPYLDERLPMTEALEAAADELKTFMLRHTREEDVFLALELAEAERPRTPEELPFRVTVPAFVLSELRTAFRMGFILFLPFVLIDMVVAAILLALGMFMLPPTMIAMPLKILLFILVDGWTLIVQSLALSFGAT